MRQAKISIVGSGSVGSTIAYSLVLKNLVSEICLIDIDEKKCGGEVADLQDAQSFSEIKSIKLGKILDLEFSDIIIIAAGARQKPGQTRAALIDVNKTVIKSIFDQLKNLKPTCIIIMVTNPVDILTCFVQNLVNLPQSQIIGSSTLLDSLRLSSLISKKLNTEQKNIKSWVIGEHGDSQVALYSSSTVSGKPVSNFITQEEFNSLAQQAKNKAYEIINSKGYTCYGVASCVEALCESIILNQKNIFPISCYSKEYNICMGLPVVLGSSGIEKYIDLNLSESEQKLLANSAQVLKKILV